MEENLRRINLLLVDDEAEFLDAIAPALARRGFDVLIAREGSEALRIAGTQPVDVVVLDVKMPGIDGVEVFRRLGLLFPALPVILLTGHGTAVQAFETSRDGVFEYLTKPCDVETLARAARRAVEGCQDRGRVSASEDGEGIRLLLVDDEADFLASLSTAMRRRGMDVIAVSTPVEAIREVQGHIFDVAVVDVKMPVMDGLEVLTRIKQAQPLLEVILLTGYPSVEKAIEALKGGSFDFMMKPVEVDDLVEKILDAYRVRKLNLQRRQEGELHSILERNPD